MTRRTFLARNALAAAGLRFRSEQQRSVANVRGRVIELRRNVRMFVTAGTPIAGAMASLSGPDGLVVVDSGIPETAANFLAGFPRTQRVVALIHTHHHRDHASGNPLFQPVTRNILAHERVPAYLSEAAAAAWPEAGDVRIDQTIAQSWTEQFGDEQVTVKHYGAAHTGGDLVVSFLRANIVHVGDLVYSRLHPFIDRAHGASLENWAGALKRVVDDHDAETIYVFSHARAGFSPTGTRADVLQQSTYLTAALDEARAGIARGWPRSLVARQPMRGFPDYVSLAPRLTWAFVLEQAYDELSRR